MRCHPYMGKIVLSRISSEHQSRCEDVFGIFDVFVHPYTEGIRYFIERFDRTRVFIELDDIISIREANDDEKHIFEIERRRFS